MVRVSIHFPTNQPMYIYKSAYSFQAFKPMCDLCSLLHPRAKTAAATFLLFFTAPELNPLYRSPYTPAMRLCLNIPLCRPQLLIFSTLGLFILSLAFSPGQVPITFYLLSFLYFFPRVSNGLVYYSSAVFYPAYTQAHRRV